MLVFEGLFKPPAHIAVDDGGMRCTWSGGGRYVPFDTMSDVFVRFTAFGIAVLQILARDGSTTFLRIVRREALDAQQAVLHHLADRPPPSVALAEGTLAALARDGLTLEDWLARVSQWAQSRAGYRSTALDHEGAKELLLDAASPPELRAACVHGMLSTGDEDDLIAVARAFAHRALPPLVVVAARLGRGGAALVPDGMLDDALAVLPLADVEAARRAVASPVTHEDEAHIHDLMARAAAAAVREATEARVHDAPSVLKKYRARPLGGYASGQGVTRFK